MGKKGGNKGGKAAAGGGPQPPTLTSVTAGVGEAIVAFVPAKKGAAATKFTVTATPGDLVAEGAASPIAVPKLAIGVAYVFTVTATSADGVSPASAASAPLVLNPPVLTRLLEGGADMASSAKAIADALKKNGPTNADNQANIGALITSGEIGDKLDKSAKEGLLTVALALLETGPVGEPFVYQLYPFIVAALNDKHKPAKTLAEELNTKLSANLNYFSMRALIPHVIKGTESYAWQSKVAAINMLTLMADKAPETVSVYLEHIVPAMTHAMGDVIKQVAQAASDCMESVCKQIDNRDVKPFIPALVSCMARPLEAPEAINNLAGTTFVTTVDAPVLAILVPVLVRGLREGSTAVIRQTCVIIDNFAKLVDDANDVRVFLPKLLPGVERASTEVPDPECRTVAERAFATLKRIEKDLGKAGLGARPNDEGVLAATFVKECKIKATGPAVELALKHAAAICGAMVDSSNIEKKWNDTLVPYLATLADDKAAKAAVKPTFAVVEAARKAAREAEDDDDEGEDLCNCQFSLAYGSKILLNQATLRLKRGRRYGLVGPNGCGKSTLMRAIVEGQLDGFPPKDQLKTVYVECDISADLAELNVTEFVLADKMLTGTPVKDVREVLMKVGFTEVMCVSGVSTLSGGWRMKLALARAMLKNADILLLDEPTNHLDVGNVTWVVEYLKSLTQVTSLIVTHDTQFLDRTCTNIVHMNNLKLKNMKGNLTDFVKAYPEAKAYYELKSATLKFNFPTPAFLEGVTSRGRALLKMNGVGFTYPNTTKKILYGIDITVSMASRCAVVGPNGAGKSTMIKLLTGELEPDEGTVWKNPNMILAYVAQHAFHHIENHVSRTANEYIQWRFQGGEDQEGLNKQANTINEDDEKKMAEQVKFEGTLRKIKAVKGRKKGRRGDEYEIEWFRDPKAKEPYENSWVMRDKLNTWGWEKVCKKIDMKALADMGSSVQRTLSVVDIEQHLSDLGLEPEFATHARISSLSTSQKVKVVLAAATWNNPHIIVLDEPTNYLDRESLGALATAINEFKGGVIMISHNNEFTSALCPETWNMSGGRLVAEGAVALEKEEDRITTEAVTEIVDARGNKTQVKAKKKEMNRKERKAFEKRKAMKIANGIPLSSDELSDPL